MFCLFFFFSSRRRHTRLTCDWSSDVCSSDLPPQRSLAAQGKTVYGRSACIGCHVIQGVSPGVIGPNLTHVGSRTTIAGGMFPNDSAHLARWIADAPAPKAGSSTTRIQPARTAADIAALVAYLEILK